MIVCHAFVTQKFMKSHFSSFQTPLIAAAFTNGYHWSNKIQTKCECIFILKFSVHFDLQFYQNLNKLFIFRPSLLLSRRIDYSCQSNWAANHYPVGVVLFCSDVKNHQTKRQFIQLAYLTVLLIVVVEKMGLLYGKRNSVQEALNVFFVMDGCS